MRICFAKLGEISEDKCQGECQGECHGLSVYLAKKLNYGEHTDILDRLMP